MRPRLIAVDDIKRELMFELKERASMRPRLIAVDDVVRVAGDTATYVAASMRPRLIAVDDARSPRRLPATSPGFNEATADRRG